MAVSEPSTGETTVATAARDRAAEYLLRRHYLRWPEALPWLIAIVCFFVFPDRMTFGSQVVIMIMFALSLDLILGYAGIVTLGHAAFFGLGAYTVALASMKLGWSEPVSGVIAAAIVAGAVGVVVGWFILRYRGLTLLMLTNAFAALLQEAGNLRSDARPFPVRPLWPHRVLVRAGGARGRVLLRAAHRLFAVRAGADRHPRERAPHAFDRLAGASPSGDGLCHLGGDRRYGGRAVHPDQRLRHADRVRFRRLRQGHGHADPRRHRAALWRVHRRRRLHDLRGQALQVEPGLLAVRHRPPAGAGGAVRAEWAARLCRTARPQAEAAAMTAALEVKGLNRSFGALHVTRDVDLSLEKGARHALIGPNGAGKTTLVNLITGVLKPSSGQVALNGDDITAWSQAERARRALARTFQINQLLRGLTVLENLCMTIGERDGNCNNMWRSAGATRAVIGAALAHLEALRLVGASLKLVRELPYGRQRLVEIAMALAQKPRVLLLDEPAAGVPSSETHLILDVVASLDPDIAVLIIEHDMDVVFRFAREITVLVAGAVFTKGTPEEIRSNEKVREVYLGEAHDHGCVRVL